MTPALVDSHCHLDDAQFDADREAAIKRALASGVTTMLAVGTGNGPPDLLSGIRLAEKYAFMWATVGVHPHDARKAAPETWKEMEALLAYRKVVAVGEIGLDYHYDLSPREVQREVFARQLEMARAAGIPIVIHTREAWQDTLRLLDEHWKAAPAGGILHCFTGGAEEAAQALDRGFYLAFGGVLTFPKSSDVQAAARRTPLDRLLIETDAPYLAPAPQRGRRNEPAFLVHTLERLAELRGETVAEIAAATTANFQRLCLRDARGTE